MDNQGEDRPTPPSQPPTAYPQPSLPAYSPPYQQAYPQMPPPGYQQGYPPVYPAMPAQGLPPSAYPLQAMAPRNRTAVLSIVLSTVGVIVHYGAYAFNYESLVRTTTRQAAVIVYQQGALYDVPVLLLAIAGLVCGIHALTRAKNQGWNGLIQAIIGVAIAIHVLIASLGLIIEYQTAASALQSLIP